MNARRPAIEVGAPILAVGAITGLLHVVRIFVWVPNFTMLYLVAVLAIAITVGSRAAILAAVASFIAFDFFFIEPLFTWTVAEPDEWVSLVVLLVAGVVTGQLAEIARRRAADAATRERDARVLFDVVRLVNEAELEDALQAVAERLLDALGAEAVLVRIEQASDQPIRVGAGSEEALTFARSTGFEGGRMLSAEQQGARRRWIGVRPGALPFRPRRSGRFEHAGVRIASEGRDLGRIVVVQRRDRSEFDPADERLLLAAASQLGRATEHRRLQREATDAEVLRRTDELRTAMLNAVSHDLRTPLASIVAAAESLQSVDVEWSEEERLEFARSIETEARRVDQMVSHLLDLSRIEAGVLRVDAQWRDLGELITSIVARLRPLADQHRISVQVPPDLPPLRFDAVAIGEVVANLVENAVRHTPAGTEIAISACPVEGAVAVEVRDSGPGLTSEAQAHLFEAFARGTRGRVRTRGSGLGLAVAKGLVEAHGGTISGGNDPRGGARFRFTLPLPAEGHRVAEDEAP
ncbi:MAG: DUF4118 domain-containing protein [Dehalococcoidia bacterium]